MQYKYAWSGVLAVFMALSMAACGNVPDDQIDHGGMLRVTSIDLTTRDIDAVRHECDPDTLQLVVAARGTANFDNAAFTDMPNPPGVKIQGYTIQYTPMDGGPQLDSFEIEHAFFVPGGGGASHEVDVLPIPAKLQFEDRVGTDLPRRYTVRYEFTGRSDYGETVRASHSISVNLANFDRTTGC